MIHIGPYTFTEQDALRTMANLGWLWTGMLEGRQSLRAIAAGDALAERLATTMGLPTATSLTETGTTAAKTLAGSPKLAGVLSDVWESLRDVADILRADGQLPPTQTGTVVQLSSSAGGVPKLAVESVEVDFGGVVGDLQRVRAHHGRPWQALCLFADEVIDTFRAEGHPIGRGSVGENITVAGLDWSQVRPGVRLGIGTVLAHVQAFAEPCNSNRQFFLGGDFNRMNIARGPVSRVYATVLRPGWITTGADVVLEPPP